MKTYCLKQSMYFRFHEDQRWIGGTGWAVQERHPLIRKMFNFLFLLLVCFLGSRRRGKANCINVKSERHGKHFIHKKWTWRIFMFFLFFCNWILCFWSRIPALKNRFYVVVFWSSVLFLTLALFLSVNMDFVAQSLASGTVDNWEEQILSSLYYYCTFGKKWKQYSGKF